MAEIVARVELNAAYGVLRELKKKLREHGWVEKKLMKGIGSIVLATAQRAFREQRLGELEWKHRYPRMSEPFINIAGVVGDFLEGKKSPPARRFDRRPAAMDTGLLFRSLTPGKALAVKGNVLTVSVPGSVVPYALAVQEGGLKWPSTQKITQTVKDSLDKWMKREKGKLEKAVKEGGLFQKEKKSRKKKAKGIIGKASETLHGFLSSLSRKPGGPMRHLKQIGTATGQAIRVAAINRLGFLFQKDELITKSVARPFLGITDAAEKEIIEYVKEVIQEEGTRGGVSLEKL